jgi:hypothetical protein
MRKLEDVYIILDALDESPRDKHREAVLRVLDDLRTCSEPGLHLLVTSREEVDIREELDAKPDETIIMKNDGINKDIASFISQYLRDNRRLRKWEEYHDRIESVLIARSNCVLVSSMVLCTPTELCLDFDGWSANSKH